MSDKIIDEVMDLIDAYAAMQGVDTYDQQVDAHDMTQSAPSSARCWRGNR